MRWEPYIQRVAVGGTGAAVTFNFPTITTGTLLRLKWIAVHNTTGSTTTMKVGVTNILGFMNTFINQTGLLTGSTNALLTDQWIMEGESLTFNFSDPGTSGPIFVTASGELYTKDPDTGDPPSKQPIAGSSY